MGKLRWRKRLNIGPLRINLSRSGIGTSLGVKGYRVTKTATGRKRTTASIPRTGLSYVTEESKMTKPKKKSKLLPILGVLLAIGIIGSCAGGNKDSKDSAPKDPPAAVQTTAPATTEPATEPQETTAPVRTYILNTSSKKFHKANCSNAKNIAEENREEFSGTRQEVIDQGYEPCGSCNP